MTITKDDLVVFKRGLYDDEEGAIYRVIEINGDRCFLELVNTSMVVRPQTLAMVSELEKYDEPASTT